MRHTIWGVCAILLLAWVPGIGPALESAVYTATFGERFVAYELLGALLVFAAAGAHLREWVRATVYGALIGFAFLIPPHQVRLFPGLFAAMALLGMGAILVAAQRLVAQRGPRDLVLLAVMLAPPVFRGVRMPLLRLTPAFLPETRDVELYLFDANYGAQLSFVLGRLFEAWPVLGGLAYRAYMAMPLAIAGLYALWLRRGQRAAVNIVVMALLLGVVGYALYPLLPASGPIYQFGTAFPNAPPPVSKLRSVPHPPSPPSAPRNCMPSLHLSWALMVLLNARGLNRIARAGAAAFLVVTVVATLGLGEHYLVDLVVAVPFTMAFQGLFYRDLPFRHPARWFCLLWSALMTAAWIAFLRIAGGVEIAPSLTWMASGLTVAGSLLAERAMVQAAASQPARGVAVPVRAAA